MKKVNNITAKQTYVNQLKLPCRKSNMLNKKIIYQKKKEDIIDK